MNAATNMRLPAAPEDDARGPPARLWTSLDYTQQVERLQAAVGETIYLAELCGTDVQLGVRLTDRPYTLSAAALGAPRCG